MRLCDYMNAFDCHTLILKHSVICIWVLEELVKDVIHFLYFTEDISSFSLCVCCQAGIPDPPSMSDDLIRQKARERHFLEQLLDGRKLENYKIPVPIKAELRKYQQVCVGRGVGKFGCEIWFTKGVMTGLRRIDQRDAILNSGDYKDETNFSKICISFSKAPKSLSCTPTTDISS